MEPVAGEKKAQKLATREDAVGFNVIRQFCGVLLYIYSLEVRARFSLMGRHGRMLRSLCSCSWQRMTISHATSSYYSTFIAVIARSSP